MRFLADAGVSPDTVAFLTRLGHDAIHVRALDMHRAQDRELVDYARSEGRVIVTFDLDFGDILAPRRAGPTERDPASAVRRAARRSEWPAGYRRRRAGGGA